MKYRKSEQRRVTVLELVMSKLDKKSTKIDNKIVQLKQLQERIRKDRFQESLKISSINKKVINRCKHNCERRYWNNMRDDASFDKYCACVNCEEVMWDECK